MPAFALVLVVGLSHPGLAAGAQSGNTDEEIAGQAGDPGPSEAEAPTAVASLGTADPPATRPPRAPFRPCGPEELPCWRPGKGRLLQAAVGAGAVAFGFVVFQVLHDSLQAGDPAGPFAAGGAIALAGAGAGALISLLSPRGEGALSGATGEPWFTLRLTPGGTRVIGESVPDAFTVQFEPQFRLGPAFRLRPSVSLRSDLGWATVVDPVPGLAEFPAAGSSREDRVRIGASALWSLPEPRVSAFRGFGQWALGVRTRVTVLRAVDGPTEESRGTTELLSLEPATLGIELALSPRQRAEAWLGFRVDRLSYSDRGSTALHEGQPYVGDLVGEVRWTHRVPLWPGAERVASNLRVMIGYLHDRTDGVSFAFGAAAGFFGPIEAGLDLQVGPKLGPWACRLGLLAKIGNGGSLGATLALVAPDVAPARRAAVGAP